LAVRFAGNGRHALFGLFAAAQTFAACLVGDVILVLQQAVTVEHDFYNILTTTDLVQVVGNIFNQMDVVSYVVYGAGVFGSALLSMRK
jgi:hypothetical protein